MAQVTEIDRVSSRPIVGVVRPSRAGPHEWVVEPADGHNAGPTRRFVGHRAPEQAASFAHQTFSTVRCFLI